MFDYPLQDLFLFWTQFYNFYIQFCCCSLLQFRPPGGRLQSWNSFVVYLNRMLSCLLASRYEFLFIRKTLVLTFRHPSVACHASLALANRKYKGRGQLRVAPSALDFLPAQCFRFAAATGESYKPAPALPLLPYNWICRFDRCFQCFGFSIRFASFTFTHLNHTPSCRSIQI